MTSISKNAYIDKLDDIVRKYNNTYHKSIKIKPIDANTYIGFKKESNDKDPKLVIMLISQMNQKNVCSVTIGIF